MKIAYDRSGVEEHSRALKMSSRRSKITPRALLRVLKTLSAAITLQQKAEQRAERPEKELAEQKADSRMQSRVQSSRMQSIV